MTEKFSIATSIFYLYVRSTYICKYVMYAGYYFLLSFLCRLRREGGCAGGRGSRWHLWRRGGGAGALTLAAPVSTESFDPESVECKNETWKINPFIN